MDYNTADIRQFLIEAFSDEELMTLCSDHYHDVYNTFASGMTKTYKIQLLIEHCQHREIIHDLLKTMYRARPEQYVRRFPQVPSIVPEQTNYPDVSGATTQASKTTARKQLDLQVADLFAQLGQAESRLEWDKVIEIGERILTLDPNDQPTRSKTAEAHKSRGMAYQEMQNYAKAIEHYNRAIKLDEKAEYHFLCAQCYLSGKGKYRCNEAIAHFDRAIELDAKAEYYAWRGKSYATKHNPGQAIENYNEAIKLDPDQPAYYLERSQSFQSMEEWQLAMSDRERADELGACGAGLELARLRAARSTEQ